MPNPRPGAMSDHHALNLIKAHLVAPPVVELGGTRAGVIGHRGRRLKRPAVLEVGRDARRTEAVVADLGHDDAGSGSARL